MGVLVYRGPEGVKQAFWRAFELFDRFVDWQRPRIGAPSMDTPVTDACVTDAPVMGIPAMDALAMFQIGRAHV